MIWDVLEHKIIDAGLGTSGRSLFRHMMPADVKTGIMTKAPLGGIEIDPYLKDYYKALIQIIVRHVDPEEGEDLAWNVQDLLTLESPEEFAATYEHGPGRFLRFFPKSLPIRYPRLDGNGFEWSLNFDAVFTVTK